MLTISRPSSEAKLSTCVKPALVQLPFTPSTKKALEGALVEASQLQHTYVGSQHLLLGVMREATSIAARLLADAGVRIEAVRDAVSKQLEVGLDVINDGEYGKTNFLNYVRERLSGFQPTGEMEYMGAMAGNRRVSCSRSQGTAWNIPPESTY